MFLVEEFNYEIINDLMFKNVFINSIKMKVF